MIIEYSRTYKKQVIALLEELQEYIASIDKEKYNITSNGSGKKYYDKTMNRIKRHNGKMFLYKEDDKILGLVVGIINNDDISVYDFKAPKRGRVIELIVTKKVRSKGIGKALLSKMEEYLYSVGCKAILLEVFGYNDLAINFYNVNGYHTRMLDMIKLR